MKKTHTVQETEDWFDKVNVTRNMKELTNHSKQFSKISEEDHQFNKDYRNFV